MKKKIFLIMLVCSFIIANINVSADPGEDPDKAEGDCRLRVCGSQGGNVVINITITLEGDDDSIKVIKISYPLQDPADYRTSAAWANASMNNETNGEYFDAEVREGRYGVEGIWYGIVDFNVKPQVNGPQYKVKSIKTSVDGKVSNKGEGQGIDPIPPLGYVYFNIYGTPSSGYVEVWIDGNWAVVYTSGKTIIQIKTEIVDKFLDVGIPAEITDNEEIFIKPMNADSGDWIGTTDSTLNLASTLYLITAPYKPITPQGPSKVNKNVEYDFTATASDPDNDRIQYGWDWNGDKQVDEWTDFVKSSESVITKHIWNADGSYNVHLKAKDEYDFESEWSEPLIVSVPKSRQYNINMFQIFFAQLTARFPFIEEIINLN